MTEDRLVEIAERIYAVDPSVPRIQRIRSDGKRGALIEPTRALGKTLLAALRTQQEVPNDRG